MKKLISVLFVLSIFLTSCASLTPSTDAGTTAPDVTVDTSDDTTELTPPASDTADTDEIELTQPTDDATTEPVEVQPTDTEPDDTESIVTDPVDTEPPATEPPRGVVYITFDDGPWTQSERVLEILDKYDIKATFFLVGKHIQKYPDGAKAIYEAGHAIGCHSVTHEYTDIYKSADAISADIAAWEAIVTDVLGEVPSERLYRFPGGSTCSAIKKDDFEGLIGAVHNMGYRVFDWTFANNDRWDGGRREGQSTEDYLKESVVTSMKLVGAPYILLLHETAGATVDTLEWTIEYLMGEGYVFDTLDNLDKEYLFRR